MKSKHLYAGILGLFSSTLFFNFSSGPTGSQGDLTGSPLSSGTCTNCHSSAGSFTPSTIISVKDGTGATISQYTPGATYTVEVQVSSTTGTPQFGTQATALLTNNNQAGSFASPNNGSKLTTSSNVQYLEHSQRSSTGLFTVQWTAPTAGSGQVTFYAGGLAVNGSSTNGDNFAADALQLQEATTTSVQSLNHSTVFKVYPNPSQGQFFIENNGISGMTNIEVYNISGQRVFSAAYNLEKDAQNSIDLGTHLTAGIYSMVLRQEGKSYSQLISIR